MFTRVVHEVRQVDVGSAGFADGRLTLDLEELAAAVRSLPRIADVALTLARPGDRTRVVSVLDIFDARWSEEGATYPGLDGSPTVAGGRRTHVLSNFQIVGSGLLPTGDGGLMVARPAFIDFWGHGASWSRFSRAPTLVADLVVDPEVQDKGAADGAIRAALVELSTRIGKLAATTPGEETAIPAVADRPPSDLPRAAYVYQIQSQGPPLQTLLYGAHLDELYPTLVDPVEILDGALVSGNRGLQTTPTISHCNNPVLLRLLDEDGRRVSVAPVVLMEGHHKTSPLKQRSANQAVQLLRHLSVDAAVFTQEGGGMSIVDQMMTIEQAKAAGIRCVGITYEMAGEEGTDSPLIFFSRAATNLVSTGNREMRVDVGAPDVVAGRGSDQTAFGDLAGAIRVPLYALYGSTSQVGDTHVQGFAA